jgi:(p)ppGpp synthase/HD superfamily hydrolase
MDNQILTTSEHNDISFIEDTFFNLAGVKFDTAKAGIISEAYKIAKDAHQEQKRDDGTSYIIHPLRIALSLLREFNIFDHILICAAFLHDVLEDEVKFSPDFLKNQFGNEVALIVETLTKPDKSKKTRKEINEIYFKRLLKSDDNCKIVKLLDKIDNLRDAHYSPRKAKQERTASEARYFYLFLAYSLDNSKLRKTIIATLKKEILELESILSLYRRIKLRTFPFLNPKLPLKFYMIRKE